MPVCEAWMRKSVALGTVPSMMTVWIAGGVNTSGSTERVPDFSFDPSTTKTSWCLLAELTGARGTTTGTTSGVFTTVSTC